MPDTIHHALVLNLHQPPGNLERLAEDPETAWEPKEILFAYDRIPSAVDGYEDVARVHLSLSGTLLEMLSDPVFQSRHYGTVKCGDLLWRLRHPSLGLLGTGFYHPVLPLIPAADREEHLLRWLGIGGHLFQRQFQGFWPPEMAFCMEMIPLLARLGYRYVLVDSEQISPITPMRWEEIRYRPHIARYGDAEIIVIPRDRTLSIAQEGGMEVDWFLHELEERTRWCPFPPLVCTATDGDNGGWFRNTEDDANFWGAFYHPLCDKAREGTSPVRPSFIHDYLDRYGAHGQVVVRTGAWNTGEHNGTGFVQWTGSGAQSDTWRRLAEVSRAIHDARWAAGERGGAGREEGRLLEEAMWRLLRAQTSCHFFWGDAWLDRCHAGLDDAEAWLARAKSASGA